MVRPHLPPNFQQSEGWYPTYMIPKTEFSKINDSGHPSGAAIQELLHPCPSGGKIFIMSVSKIDKKYHRKRAGCNSARCKQQGTRIRSIECQNPKTGEDSIILELSNEHSVHETKKGAIAFAFRDGLEQFLLSDVDEENGDSAQEANQATRDHNEDAQPEPVQPRNRNKGNANGDLAAPSTFRRLFTALSDLTVSSTATVPFTNNNASIVQWLEDANLKTDDDLLKLARQYIDAQNAHDPVVALRDELGLLMPSIPSELCRNVTAAVFEIIKQDKAQNMLATLDDEQKYLDEVEAKVSAATGWYNDGKVRIYIAAIKQAKKDTASDRVIAHLLLRLAKLLLKYKVKSNVALHVWKPVKIQSEALIKAIDVLIQQAVDRCNSMTVERFSRNAAELKRQERDGLIDWKPLEAEVKFFAGKVKLLQGNFKCAALFFKEAADVVELAKADAVQIHVPTHFANYSQDLKDYHDRAKHLISLKEECSNLTTNVLVTLSSPQSKALIGDIMHKLDECSKEALASTDIINRKCILMARDGSWEGIIALLRLEATANKNCMRALRVVINRDPFPGASRGLDNDEDEVVDNDEVEVVVYLPPELCHWYIRALRFVSKFSQGKQCVDLLESLRQEHRLDGLDWLSSEKDIMVSTEKVCANVNAGFEILRNSPPNASNITGSIIQDIKRCLQKNSDFSNSHLHVDLNYWLAHCYTISAENEFLFMDTKYEKLGMAADCYTIVLTMHPEIVNIWLDLAKVHTEMAKSLKYSSGREEVVKECFRKALDNCLSALKINNESMDALLCRADIFFDMDLAESALDDYTRWMNLYRNPQSSNTDPNSDPEFQHVRLRLYAAQAKVDAHRRDAANAAPRVHRGRSHRRSISQVSPRTYKALGNHERLGLEGAASRQEVKTAYRKYARLFHPDKGGDEEMFKLLGDAYKELLKDFEN